MRQLRNGHFKTEKGTDKENQATVHGQAQRKYINLVFYTLDWCVAQQQGVKC